MSRKKRKRTTSLFVRITDAAGNRRYCPPVWNSNGTPRVEMAFVSGMPQRHPEAVFDLRYRSFDGALMTPSLPDDGPHGANRKPGSLPCCRRCGKYCTLEAVSGWR